MHRAAERDEAKIAAWRASDRPCARVVPTGTARGILRKLPKKARSSENELVDFLVDCPCASRAWRPVADPTEGEDNMATYLAFHEVDDVEHWLKSGKREEFFGPHGITARTFRDPNGSNRVGMIVEIPDFAVFERLMQTEGAAEAMKYDGVRPETLVILAAG